MRFQRKTGHQLLTLGFFILLALSLPFLAPIPTLSYQQSSLSQQESGLETLPTYPLSRTSDPIPQPDASSLPFSLGNLLVVYGSYVNESSQEPVEIWISLFEGIGFNTTTIHIADFTVTPDYDLIVVTPSVGTSTASFGVSVIHAQTITACPTPVLLLGYGHEVLDQVWDINPNSDFIPCIESYLWSPNEAFQIFSLPHTISHTSGRFNIYSDHIFYDAYRITSLPEKVEILGTNALGSGAQILWFRALPTNPHLYYWGIDQTENLSPQGINFCENLILWLIRPLYQDRLGNTLASFQLETPFPTDYWAVQGAGGFGSPLEPSLRFTYYVTDLVQTYGLVVNISSFGPWLLSTYNSLHGYFEDLASPQLQDRCTTTSMSVLTADALGMLSQLDVQQLGDYIAACQDPITGGFFTEQGASQTNLEATRYAVEALMILGQLSKIDVGAIVSYVDSCQDGNPLSTEYGGFYSSPVGEIVASLVHALDALTILNHIVAVDTINQTALLSFIMACEDPNGSSVFDTKLTLDSDELVLGTSCALQLLTILDALELIDIDASRDFILINQYSNGGWGRGDVSHDFHNTPNETWYAVQSLTITGGLATVQDALTAYLIQCCTGWGGATEPILFGDFLTSTQIISALYQVDALNAMNLTAFLTYLNYCWSHTRSSFCVHQSPPSVGTDTDTPTPDRTVLESGTFGPLYHYMYARIVPMLNLTGNPWTLRSDLIRQEIELSQTLASNYAGMFGLHHLYVGRESDYTFRFDTTCWSLLAHGALGGQSGDLMNATAALSYLQNCLQGNGTHQYFLDTLHSIPFPDPWRSAEGYLANTWFGLQAWAYLDPSLTGLNGQALATHANHYLQSNPTLVTTYYATEILYFLTESGLYPEAVNLFDHEELAANLLTYFTYQGLVVESSIPKGKWTTYLLDMALQLINRLNLLPLLDVSPVLDLTQITYPQGTLPIGAIVDFSASVNETRWNQLPNTINIYIQIFDTTYSNSSSPINPRNWELQETIPTKQDALGPQNLIITAIATGAIPFYGEYASICEVWGNITVQATYLPSLSVTRSNPLNVSIQLNLEGSTSVESQITNGEVILAIESPQRIYTASHQGLGIYSTQIQTLDLDPGAYMLQVNASAPYCT
ncbi:MAG: prenyltransferase/squalene oxidase repeat-containing protein, partial [Candidatus Hermodarchaeia archaeon]